MRWLCDAGCVRLADQAFGSEETASSRRACAALFRAVVGLGVPRGPSCVEAVCSRANRARTRVEQAPEPPPAALHVCVTQGTATALRHGIAPAVVQRSVSSWSPQRSRRGSAIHPVL